VQNSFRIMKRIPAAVAARVPCGLFVRIVGPGRHTPAMGNDIPPALRALARVQAGVVSRPQALDGGVSAGAITAKLRFGRWRQIHRGVYATFTGPVDRPARLWAAVLYAGKGAQLSHETAAELHGLTDRRAPLIHITIPSSRRVAPVPGMLIHIRARADDARFPRGTLPYTFLEDTILDLVEAADNLDDVCGWVTRAFGKRLTSEGPLRAAMSRRKKLRWRRQLDDIVTAAAGGAHSVLEFRYDRDVERAHGLPPARRQVPFSKADGRRGFRDRCYPEFGGLVVELDGKAAHPAENRRQDRTRDNAAAAGGGTTLRYEWDDVTRDACETAAQVAESLRKRGWTGRLKPCSPGCRALPASARQSA
jgi:hypothetical protein